MVIEKNKLLFIHTPKTGGGSMESYFYQATKKIRRNYFLSFNGTDDSRYIQDERSTPREMGNKTLIESICKDEKIVDIYKTSPHFAEAKMLFGHTNMVFPSLFPECNFEIMMVLRDPLERVISNVVQFSSQTNDGRVKFGNHYTNHEKYSIAYWGFIYEILTEEFPLEGIMIHDNYCLRDCMCHMISGNPYKDFSSKIDLDFVFSQLEQMNISFYDDFNNGLQANFDKLNIAIDMAKNYIPINAGKSKLGKYYGAPEKVVEIMKANNQNDITLYNHLRGKV